MGEDAGVAQRVVRRGGGASRVTATIAVVCAVNFGFNY